jgi:hypothetical protein
VPAFYPLINDGKVDLVELQTVEKQSTSILITAFAILVSLIVQARSFNLSACHTSIVLSLSWMNNTNTFVHFLLYIHHKSDLERGDQRHSAAVVQVDKTRCLGIRTENEDPSRRYGDG